ncbi:MAG TPA: PucR family transcriptional regulator ligand-binding domain-containing protein [Streptosporangiaceae bacterium]|jgi:purine catabolism regulator
MLPTVAEILALDPLRRGAPKVVAAADRLDAPVRWVHVIELAEAAHLLRGGELVLSTGIALPGDPGGLARYVADLASVGVSALAVELGSRYARSLPAALVSAAASHRLPLIVLQRETQFIEITEAVHARIIDTQLEELRASEHLHQVFTDLAVSGAPAGEVIRQAATLSGCPVILENVAHQVLACEPAGHDTARLLAGFAARSRAVTPPGRTGYDPASGWLVTVVGARGEDWGRLIMVRGGPAEPRDVALVERAATTLALGRLLDHERESLERQAHRTILGAFLGHGYAEPAEAEARARALGVPVTGRRLLAVVVRLSHGDTGLEAHARALRSADVMAAACRSAQVPALVGTLDDIRVGGLLALAPRADPDAALSRLAARLRRQLGDDDVIGAGSVVESVLEVQRSFLEAEQVAEVAARDRVSGAGAGRNSAGRDGASRNGAGRDFYRLPDLRLRGLLHLLRDDPRVQAFAERELGPLLRRDDATGSQLVATLTAYLEAGGNKAEAARRAHLARPTLYERLKQIEAVLGVSLESAQSLTSLHVAVLAHTV